MINNKSDNPRLKILSKPMLSKYKKLAPNPPLVVRLVFKLIS